MNTEVILPTSLGRARLLIGNVRGVQGLVVLGHGAGTGIHTPDLELLAKGIEGAAVIRLEQPWVLAGRKMAPAAHLLDEVWLEVLNKRHTWLPLNASRLPMIVGGRSAGARVAARTAIAINAVGVLGLAFPLHAPKKTGRRRDSELDALLEANIPLHVIQGDRDGFGIPGEFHGVDVTPVPGRGHELLRNQQDEHANLVLVTANNFVAKVLHL